MNNNEKGKKLLKYINKEKKDVVNIYFYAILSGLVQLSSVSYTHLDVYKRQAIA